MITFKKFVELARVEWFRGDPMLMGAAIAYNSLFALVPLGVAFVSMVKLLGLSETVTDRIDGLINATLPPDIAGFITGIFDPSASPVGSGDTIVLILSIVVALWSGSRAVTAVQKSLRLVQAVPDERGYLRSKAVGVLVTVGAGVSVLVGYSLLLFGESLGDAVASAFGRETVSLGQFSLTALIAVWVFGMLWAIYRFGPPYPVPHTAAVALAVEVALIAGGWLAFTLVPEDSLSAGAAFGVLGVILVLLYFVGVTVVAVPILVTSAWEAWDSSHHRYAPEDADGTVESQGSSQGSEPPREAAR